MRATAAAACLAALLGALAASPRGHAQEPPAFTEVPLPETADLVAPPRVTYGADGRALLAIPVPDGIDLLRSTDGTRRVFDPVVAAVRHAGLATGGRRGPRIAAHGATVVLAAITRKTKEGGGDLLAWRSADGGTTWSAAVTVTDAPGCAAEGLFDLAALADGRFVALWLDGRVADGGAKGATLYADFLGPSGAWGEDAVAYASPGGSVCECCAPAVVPSADGGAVAAFRNSLNGQRDVWTLRLAAGAARFDDARKSGGGSWPIRACPMAAPAVASRGADVVAAWRREKEVFLVDGAEKERALGAGAEPVVVVRPAGAHVLWTDAGALLHAAPGAKSPARLAEKAAYVSAAASSEGKVAADLPGLVTWHDTAARRARLAEVR